MGDLISRETVVAILRAKADMTIGEVKDAASFFDYCANMIEKLLAVDVKIDGNTSDGYHTFDELYHHRAVLFSVIVKAFPERAWKSRKHHDGTMYDGMFIVGVDTPQGQATYHYDIDPYWGMFACRELDRAPEWDGHTPAEAITRIGALEPVKHAEWTHLGGDEWRCTHCGEVIHTEGGWEKPTYKYCRECGARMDGGEKK